MRNGVIGLLVRLGAIPPGAWIGGTGFGVITVSAVGYFMRLDAAPTTAFLLFGSGLVLAAPLIDRLDGQQKLSPTGFEMNVLARRDDEVLRGQVHPLESKPSEVEIETPRLPSVVIADGAYAELQALAPDSRAAVGRVIQKLESDPEAVLSRANVLTGGDFAGVYSIPASAQLRVIVRQVDKPHPDSPTQYAILQVSSYH